MNTWTDGYLADIGYTFGYYEELNPLRIKMAFLNAGLVAPNVGSACELGFGQGVSASIHAAASCATWHGTDFNPSHASFAQELAAVSGSGAQLFDDAFHEFCNRPDLPDFDSIGLHGIWSWISDQNRAVIVDFVRRKLKVGGVLYISYNTLPGWAAFAPIRHLLTQHAEVLASHGHGIVKRIDSAIEFSEKLFATNPAFLKSIPFIADRLQQIKGQNRNYVAHEYFNRDWQPMHFATMAKWLAPAKLDFACSAHYLSHVNDLNLTEEQQALLNEIPDDTFRETSRDFMVNQQFRKDYWVRGARKLTSFEQGEAQRAQRVMLVTHRPDISLTVMGVLGESNLNEEVYLPILTLLADHQPRTVAQIELAIHSQGVSFGRLMQALLVLAGAGHLVSVQSDEKCAKAKIHTVKLNDYLTHKAKGSGDITYLASPVSGGGIGVSRFEQLFLLALNSGKNDPTDWAQLAWEILVANGQKILKDGESLESDEENLAELNAQAANFSIKKLPVLEALQVV